MSGGVRAGTRAPAPTCAELVCVGEGVFNSFMTGITPEDWFSIFLMGARLAQVGQGECHTAAALGELQQS